MVVQPDRRGIGSTLPRFARQTGSHDQRDLMTDRRVCLKMAAASALIANKAAPEPAFDFDDVGLPGTD